ncbi:MAG: DUF433 domain-containing protein [Gammaproteobacteria bacterium]|nr:DUF433 domain-containing protein [Gammaproteobacteria bacterium]
MRASTVQRNREVLGGTPVFFGTRVPVQILMDHMQAGDCLADFLVDYPTVSHDQAVAVLMEAAELLLSHSHEAAA